MRPLSKAAFLKVGMCWGKSAFGFRFFVGRIITVGLGILVIGGCHVSSFSMLFHPGQKLRTVHATGGLRYLAIKDFAGLVFVREQVLFPSFGGAGSTGTFGPRDANVVLGAAHAFQGDHVVDLYVFVGVGIGNL